MSRQSVQDPDSLPFSWLLAKGVPADLQRLRNSLRTLPPGKPGKALRSPAVTNGIVTGSPVQLSRPPHQCQFISPQRLEETNWSRAPGWVKSAIDSPRNMEAADNLLQQPALIAPNKGLWVQCQRGSHSLENRLPGYCVRVLG